MPSWSNSTSTGPARTRRIPRLSAAPMGRRSTITTTATPAGQASECTSEATKASPFTGLTLPAGAQPRMRNSKGCLERSGAVARRPCPVAGSRPASRSPRPDPAVVAEHPPWYVSVSARLFERGEAGRLDRDDLVPGPRRIAGQLNPANPGVPMIRRARAAATPAGGRPGRRTSRLAAEPTARAACSPISEPAFELSSLR